MKVVHDKIVGPFRLTQDLRLHGMIAGNATVPVGITLHLHGMVTGDLTIDPGGRVVVRGMVNGTVRNGGMVDVYGKIDAIIETSELSKTTIHSGAVLGT